MMSTYQPPVILTQTWVSGVPKTKGSLDNHGGHMVENVPGSARWRQIVATAVKADMTTRDPSPYPYAGPVELKATLWLPPPASWLTDDNPWRDFAIWIKAGDTDKLTRNIGDALQRQSESGDKKCAGLIVDDNQITRTVVDKRPADGAGPGLLIHVQTDVNTDSGAAFYRNVVMRRMGLL